MDSATESRISSIFSIRVYTDTGSNVEVNATIEVIGFSDPILANSTKAKVT